MRASLFKQEYQFVAYNSFSVSCSPPLFLWETMTVSLRIISMNRRYWVMYCIQLNLGSWSTDACAVIMRYSDPLSMVNILWERLLTLLMRFPCHIAAIPHCRQPIFSTPVVSLSFLLNPLRTVPQHHHDGCWSCLWMDLRGEVARWLDKQKTSSSGCLMTPEFSSPPCSWHHSLSRSITSDGGAQSGAQVPLWVSRLHWLWFVAFLCLCSLGLHHSRPLDTALAHSPRVLNKTRRGFSKGLRQDINAKSRLDSLEKTRGWAGSIEWKKLKIPTLDEIPFSYTKFVLFWWRWNTLQGWNNLPGVHYGYKLVFPPIRTKSCPLEPPPSVAAHWILMHVNDFVLLRMIKILPWLLFVHVNSKDWMCLLTGFVHLACVLPQGEMDFFPLSSQNLGPSGSCISLFTHELLLMPRLVPRCKTSRLGKVLWESSQLMSDTPTFSSLLINTCCVLIQILIFVVPTELLNYVIWYVVVSLGFCVSECRFHLWNLCIHISEHDTFSPKDPEN